MPELLQAARAGARSTPLQQQESVIDPSRIVCRPFSPAADEAFFVTDGIRYRTRVAAQECSQGSLGFKTIEGFRKNNQQRPGRYNNENFGCVDGRAPPGRSFKWGLESEAEGGRRLQREQFHRFRMGKLLGVPVQWAMQAGKSNRSKVQRARHRWCGEIGRQRLERRGPPRRAGALPG